MQLPLPGGVGVALHAPPFMTPKRTLIGIDRAVDNVVKQLGRAANGTLGSHSTRFAGGP